MVVGCYTIFIYLLTVIPPGGIHSRYSAASGGYDRQDLMDDGRHGVHLRFQIRLSGDIQRGVQQVLQCESIYLIQYLRHSDESTL